MKKLLHLLIIPLIVLTVSCSADDPQSQLNKIDDLLSKGFPLTSEQSEGVTTLVSQGKSLLEQGQKKKASEKLEEAITILNLARDADIYNKAD